MNHLKQFFRCCTNNGALVNTSQTIFTSHQCHKILIRSTPQFLVYPYQPSRNAGHSKWANIKHVKQAKDLERSKDITKFMNMIKIAVKEGSSPDPTKNSKLANVISQIKDAKLSMASFDKLLQNLQARKDEKSQVLVFRGPGGCILLGEISSDNLNRSKQEINTILRKNKAINGEESLLNLFDHKGIILSTGSDGKAASEDHIDNTIADAIEVGADDVTFQSDNPDFGPVYEFITAPSAFFKVKHALESMKYDIVSGDVEFIPSKPIELEGAEIEDAIKLYQKLTEHPNVVKVFTNIL